MKYTQNILDKIEKAIENEENILMLKKTSIPALLLAICWRYYNQKLDVFNNAVRFQKKCQLFTTRF